MAKNPLFSTYRQGENRVTASMLAVFERVDLGVVEELFAAASGESSLVFVTFANQVASHASSIPDAAIEANFRYLFEVKTVADAVDRLQLEGHLESLDGAFADERLFVITPDVAQPDRVTEIGDPRLVWFNFVSLSQAIDGVLNDPMVPISEQARFLLRELQALFLHEGLLAHQDVVVVAARRAYPEYLNLSAYICAAGRSFRRGVRRMGFYTNNAIQPEVPKILGCKDNVLMTRDAARALASSAEELDREIAHLIDERLDQNPYAEGYLSKIFVLSSRIDPRTIKLPHPIRNAAVDRHGDPTPWTQGQRYTNSDVLGTDPQDTDAL
jgi:hypothetical protein